MRDLTQTPDDLVRELLNEKAGLPYPATQTNLIFGKPSALLDDERGQTQVAIRGIEDSDYRNRPTQVFYDRLDLGTLFAGNFTPEFTALGQSTLHRLLPELNKALGINLTARDVENIDVSQLGEGEQVNIQLQAKAGSLAYTGYTTIVFNRRLIYLTDVITTTVFDEFQHPDPHLQGYTSAGLLTWGLDFTLIGADLEVREQSANYRGDFRYLSRLQQSLVDNYGIENWPGNDTDSAATGRIRDYDTRKVDGANTDFQRVVVQTEIRENGYVGTAYFHYNPL